MTEAYDAITTARVRGRGARVLRDREAPDPRCAVHAGRLPADARAHLAAARPRVHGVHLLGGGRDFVRPVSEEMYGIPRESVIGSATTLEYRDGAVYRTRGVEQPIDDGPGKPVHIWTRTGRTPLLAGGNADGDVAMLETARFGLLVHHDDRRPRVRLRHRRRARARRGRRARLDRGEHEERLRDDLLTHES